LPSDTRYITLLNLLRDITKQIKAALADNELDHINPLLLYHRRIMARLTSAGNCKDPGLLYILRELNADVEFIKTEIEIRQKQIRKQLNVMTNKKKLTRAYAM